MRNKNIPLVFVCLFAILTVVSCGSNSQSSSNTESIPKDTLGKIALSEDTATAQDNDNQTDTSSQPAATPTPTSTSTPTPTPKATPTATPRPWLIPTAVPTLTSIPVPTPLPVQTNPTETPTPTPATTDVAINPETCEKATGKTQQMCMEMAIETIQNDPTVCDAATGMMALLCTSMPPQQQSVTHGGAPGDGVPNPCDDVDELYKSRCEESLRQDRIRESTDGEKKEETGYYIEGTFDPDNIPKVAKANFAELDKISRTSKFRSGVGHDFSFNTPEFDPTGASCRSMKHYMIPVGVPKENELYSRTPHAFEWMTIKFFAPTDGVIQDVIYTMNSYGKEAQFTISSNDHAGYYFNFFHVALDPNLVLGSKVKAGQYIGTLGSEEAWVEIAVEVRIGSREA